MRWKLEIDNQELANQIGNILFATILPENEPELFSQVQENLMSGTFTYTVNEIKDNFVITSILEHKDVEKYNLASDVFNDNLCLQINPVVLTNHTFIALYDSTNYLFLFKIDDHVYKFNFGFYLMILNVEEYAQKLGFGNLIGNIEADKFVDKGTENQESGDFDLDSDPNIVM